MYENPVIWDNGNFGIRFLMCYVGWPQKLLKNKRMKKTKNTPLTCFSNNILFHYNISQINWLTVKSRPTNVAETKTAPHTQLGIKTIKLRILELIQVFVKYFSIQLNQFTALFSSVGQGALPQWGPGGKALCTHSISWGFGKNMHFFNLQNFQ